MLTLVWQSPEVLGIATSLTLFAMTHFISHFLYGAVLVSTGVVRPDKRAAAPDRDKTGNFLNLTDNRTVALAA